MKKEIIHSFYSMAMGLLGSLNKDDVDDSENVIWERKFVFLHSFVNYSKSLYL